MQNSNRAARRALRAKAKAHAGDIAKTFYDYDSDGRLIPVSDPRAVAVLTRAVTLMIRSGKPVTLELSEAEVMAFPRRPEDAHLMRHALAVWIDAGGRATYSIRSVVAWDTITGVPEPSVASQAAEEAARESLADACATSGFPIGRTEGRA